MDSKGRISAFLADLEWIYSSHIFHPKRSLVTMLLHVPCEDANSLEINVRISAPFSFANDVPINLTCQRILDAVNHLHRCVNVFFAVRRDLHWDVELERPGQNPAHFSRGWTNLDPDIVRIFRAGARFCHAVQYFDFRSAIELPD